jgi:hypothetical protein
MEQIVEVARCCVSQVFVFFVVACRRAKEKSKIAALRAKRKIVFLIFNTLLPFQSLRSFCHVEGTICPISFVKETLVGPESKTSRKPRHLLHHPSIKSRPHSPSTSAKKSTKDYLMK